MQLSEQQLAFFDTFGYVGFPGLMADAIEDVTNAFEEVWTERGGGHNGQAHDGKQRSCIVPFIDQHERLSALLDDPRIHGLLTSLLGPDFNYMGSDGNYYAGDTVWHSDGWGKAVRFVKVAFYLDPLTRDTGCLRVIPGSHHLEDRFALALQGQIRKSNEDWGTEGKDLPALALETQPGDIFVFNHNLKHAAFGGSAWRRMFTINCSQRFPEDRVDDLKKYISAHARFWTDRIYGETMIATAGPQRRIHLEQGLANDGHLAALAAKARAEMPEPSRG
ncbi:MAG: phytanoyl-CoA dioxygenase family protein [bacterium]|nr:phytanoyl-CoA dioxygenase family protein [bacterium]